jgi:hypothetical protein
MPRRRAASYIFGLCPWWGLWRNRSEGLSPYHGRSPGIIWLLSRGIATAAHPAAKPNGPLSDWPVALCSDIQRAFGRVL